MKFRPCLFICLFVAVSLQTRFDTRSKARRPKIPILSDTLRILLAGFVRFRFHGFRPARNIFLQSEKIFFNLSGYSLVINWTFTFHAVNCLLTDDVASSWSRLCKLFICVAAFKSDTELSNAQRVSVPIIPIQRSKTSTYNFICFGHLI